MCVESVSDRRKNPPQGVRKSRGIGGRSTTRKAGLVRTNTMLATQALPQDVAKLACVLYSSAGMKKTAAD